MEAWRNRDLEPEYIMVYIDAVWVKVKRDTIQNEAFYIVMGLKRITQEKLLG